MKSSRMIKLTPEIATHLLSRNTYIAQRKAKDSRVNELVCKISDGRFHVAVVAVAHVPDVDDILMNGQHTCLSVIESGQEVDCCFIEHFCESEDDIPTIFAQYDDHGARTQGQIAKAFSASIGEGWSDRCASTCSSALAWEEYGMNFYTRSTKDDRSGLLARYRHFVGVVNQEFFASGTPCSFMQRVPVVAAAFRMFGKDNELFMKFWRSVREGELLERDDPEFRLRDYLLSRKARSSGAKRECFCKCIHAWNACRRGKTTDLKYFPAAPLPEAV